jgi:hypothetical protein
MVYEFFGIQPAIYLLKSAEARGLSPLLNNFKKSIYNRNEPQLNLTDVEI